MATSQVMRLNDKHEKDMVEEMVEKAKSYFCSNKSSVGILGTMPNANVSIMQRPRIMPNAYGLLRAMPNADNYCGIPPTPNIRKPQACASVSLINRTTARIIFEEKHDWSGQIVGSPPYPSGVPSDCYGSFIHLANPMKGRSAGAVIYSGNNRDGAFCAWLLAWFAPTNPSESNPNKVYVECGPKSNFANIDWDIIYTKLCASHDYENNQDPVTRTAIAARISREDDYVAVGATFQTV